MELKTYQGNSMSEVLAKVKRDLGPEAVILHTRTLERGGVMGVGGRTVVEITASRDARLLPPAPRGGRMPPRGIDTTWGDTGGRPVPTRPAEGAAMARRSSSRTTGPESRAEMTKFISSLRGEMGEIRAMVRELLDREADETDDADAPHLPEELRRYYTGLIQNAVADEIAREVMAEAHQRLEGRSDGLPDMVRTVLAECIGRMLPSAEPIRLDGDATRYVALVGPTGVGKTTTIAKLAAHFKLRQGKRVGLITTDTYRIAAVEQLRAYAEILDLPLEVVLTPEDMTASVASTRGLDLVLIDTSGRSQRDARRLEELKGFIDAIRTAAGDGGHHARDCGDDGTSDASGSDARLREPRNVTRGPDGRFRSRRTPEADRPPVEVHLVLSCAAHPAQLVEAAEKFAAVGLDRVVFTKLDEAVGSGVILNVARQLDLRLSYLTTGQDVPDDIEVGHRRRIAELILAPEAGPAPTAKAVTNIDHVA